MDGPNLPIDIHLTKLLDWILDRRHCPRDWQKSVIPIRSKINLAIQDMPEHAEITKLLHGSAIHYFNCLKIVEILKETEKDTKNFLGMYSSQRMKDWNAIVSAYQKNNVYLGEAASILQRNMAYEVPALRKAIQKCVSTQKECEDKAQSQSKSIGEINNQIKQLCIELGIQGDDISAELKQLPKQLTSIFDTIFQKCSQLDKAVAYYTAYVGYFFKRKPNEAVPFLAYFLKKGNTTVFEWRTGVEPKLVERAEVEYNFADEKKQQQEENAVTSNEINFDMEDDPSLLATDQSIDWGDTGISYDTEDANAAPSADTIDFDIDALRSEIVVEGSGVYIPADGKATGDDALNILEWPETRNLLLDDLIKLDTFLKQKLYEMKSGSDNLLVSTILQDAPKEVQSITEKDLRHFIDSIAAMQSYLKQKKVEQLLCTNDNPKYLQRIYDKFVAKRKSIARCQRNQEQLKVKGDELVAEEKSLNEQMKLIVQKTKELQKYVSEDLSKKYNGTRINIMGEINTL